MVTLCGRLYLSFVTNSTAKFGLIINRPSKKQFRELFDDMSESPKMRDDDFLFVGGPVPESGDGVT